MNQQKLLAELDRRKVKLSVVEGKLKFQAPTGALDDRLRYALREHKADLLKMFGHKDVSLNAERFSQSTFTGLSFAQLRLWFLDQLDSESNAYGMQIAWRCTGKLDIEALTKSLNHLIHRHEPLRTTFSCDDKGEVCQVINQPQTINLEAVNCTRNSLSLNAEIIAFFEEPLRIEHDQLLRARLYELDVNVYVLAIATHHIAFDGWSTDILNRELAEGYRSFSVGGQPRMTPLSFRYSDYAEWQRHKLSAGELKRQLHYWKEQLSGDLPVLDLPMARARPTVQSHFGESVELVISSSLLKSLKLASNTENVTLFMYMLSAFKVLLFRTTGQKDIVVGTPVTNRRQVEWEPLIGLFVNTLVLRTDLGQSATFKDLLQTVRDVTLSAWDNQDVPFEVLVQELQPIRDPAITPLFQIMFIMQNTPLEPLVLEGLETELLPYKGQIKSKYDLGFLLIEKDDELICQLEFCADLIDIETAQLMLAQFESILNSVVESADIPINSISLLSEQDKRRLLEDYNQTSVPVEQDLSIDEMFQLQVSRSPDQIAIHHSNQQFTYRQIDKMVESTICALIRKGVNAGAFVGIFIDRSVYQVVAILSVSRIAAIWTPLDPDYPKERLEFMCLDSGVQILLSLRRLKLLVSPHRLDVLYIDDLQESTAGELPNRRSVSSISDSAAYLLYTSGSSGAPKGVLGTHKGIANRLEWMWREFPFDQSEINCIKTSLNFVDSIWEMFGAMLQGIPSVIVSNDVLLDPVRFIELLRDRKITRLVTVPSFLTALLDRLEYSEQTLPSLKVCISSGESLSSSIAQRFRRLVPDALLLNLYGSSEVAADISYHVVTSEDSSEHLPIGRPIANTKLYVLDSNYCPVSVGVTGELYAGGAGVALGYHSRGDLNDHAFRENPFSAGRMYRTGDLARWNFSGELEYMGRVDRQRQLRGFRVECSEVESVIMRCPGVRQCHVDIADFDEDAYLRAFVELLPNQQLEKAAILAHAARTLPDYMVPSRLYICEKIPLNPSGKLDIASLELFAKDYSETLTNNDSNCSELEGQLKTVWEKTLKLKSVSVTDNFFDLGGHSLLAVKMVSHMESEFGIRVPLGRIFEYPNIRDLAQYLERSNREVSTKSMMIMREKRAGLPLFLLPPTASTGLFFSKLIEILPENINPYSFDSISVSDYSSIEELAAHYIVEMQSVQDTGPWYLGSACLGSHIAFEIAQQLRAQGQRKLHLFVIDSSPPYNGPDWTYTVEGPRSSSYFVFYLGILKNEYYKKGLKRLMLRQKRKIEAIFDPTIKAYDEVWTHQFSLLTKYRCVPGSVEISLLLSKEYSEEPHLIERWKSLSTFRFKCLILAEYHNELALHDSSHWSAISSFIENQFTSESRIDN